MSFEEEFDKIIRQKAEEQKYPFDEGNWEKASRMLDAEKQATGLLSARKYYLPAVLAVAIGAVGFITLNYFSTGSSEAAVAVVAASNQSEIKSGNLTGYTQPEQINNTPVKNEIKKPIGAAVGSENTPGNPNPTDANSSGTEVSDASKIQAKLTGRTKKQTPSLTGSPNVAIKVGSEQPANMEPEQGENLKSNPIVNVNAVPEAASKKVDENPASSKDEAPVLTGNYAGGTNGDDKKAINSSEIFQNNNEVTAAAVDIVQAERLNSVYSVLPEVTSDPDLMATSFNLLKRYDEDYYKKGKRSKTHYFNAEAGTTYLLGWNTQKGNDGQGFNWFGGFNYGMYLTKKISVGIGLQAYNIGNMDQPFFSGSTKQYSFGSTTSYTMITSKELIFAAVPLKINYAVNTLNTVGVGFNTGYTLRSKNIIDAYTTDSEKGTTHNAPVKNNDLYEGTSTTNFMLSAHYSRVLGKRFALNAEFVYGITDLFSSERLVKNTEKPMGLRLSIHYTLFDK